MSPILKPPVPKKPSIRVERDFSAQCGGVPVAGVDEAGRGPLAGPVVAAAVILPYDNSRPRGLRDSKQLNERRRERLFDSIKRLAVSYGIGIVTAQEIDMTNILAATRLAALRALEQLDPPAGALVTDCLELPGDPRPILPMVKGDRISASIAAASILAKVTRDRMMNAYHKEFPMYGWDTNKGYPTPDHVNALLEHGPTTLHRMTFQGVGFFTASPRRSASYVELRRKLEISHADPGNGAGTVQDVMEEIARRSLSLPPPDLAELQRLYEQLQGTET